MPAQVTGLRLTSTATAAGLCQNYVPCVEYQELPSIMFRVFECSVLNCFLSTTWRSLLLSINRQAGLVKKR